jgi:hypothetical protein
LRELVKALGRDTYLTIVGTGVSMDDFEDSASYDVSKRGVYAHFCLLGGFDHRERMERYVRQYVLPAIVTARLLDRLHLWLQGRYAWNT